MKIKIIKTQKVLSPTQISIGDYVINPYRGCEFGCLYCYSQENKNLQKSNFYNFLGIKINAHLVLERQLYYINPKRVVLGSTTECFQYKELEYKITERILEVLNKYKIPYTILTKSHLIKNYLHLIAQNPKNKIYFTFNCNSDEIIKILEKRSPNIKERLEAIEEILRKNINLRLHIGPFIPYISNLEEILKKIPKEIKEIDIEIYHYKMGNFKEMLEVIKKNISEKISKDISYIYEKEKNYINFMEELKKKIIVFKNINRNIKFFYIVPNFNNFYDKNINYDKAL